MAAGIIAAEASKSFAAEASKSFVAEATKSFVGMAIYIVVGTVVGTAGVGSRPRKVSIRIGCKAAVYKAIYITAVKKDF